MRHIYEFFNQLRLHAGAVWVEDEGLKLSTPKALQNEEVREFVMRFKNDLVSILVKNEIFSKKDFGGKTIFADTLSETYPLSPAQERLWFIEQLEEGANAYHVPQLYEINPGTEIEGIKYALQQVIRRHEILRTTVGRDAGSGRGIQQVHDEPLGIEKVVLPVGADYVSLIASDVNKPFDLSREYPVRVKFYVIGGNDNQPGIQNSKTLLLINTHHIAIDGWSMDILRNEIVAYYEAYVNKDSSFSLPALAIQYKDFASWQRTFVAGDIIEKQLAYWKKKLSGYQTLEFPIDYIRPVKKDYRGQSHTLIIDEETSIKLRQLALAHGVTLQSVLLSGLNILLGKYTGQNDIVVGSPIANRHHQQTQDLIGFFVNTLVNRTVLDNAQTFEALIQQVHHDQVEAQLHQDLPFDRLVDELGVERDALKHPVFQVAFSLQNFGSIGHPSSAQTRYLKPCSTGDVYNVEKFDLSFFAEDAGDTLSVAISYATSLFRHDTIVALANRYEHLMKQLAAAPGKPYRELSLLDAEEYHRVIHQWNATGRNFPQADTIVQLFETQAAKTPDAIAVVYEQQRLTFKELNEHSNQLAHQIRYCYRRKTGESLTAGAIIALCVDRSAEMILGMLAILKAGGAYVPIDSSYPRERIDFILQDTGAELVLTRRNFSDGNSVAFPGDMVLFIDLADGLYAELPAANLPRHSDLQDLAYVIYTSGTTGHPKGVMLEHKSLINLLFIQRDELKIREGLNVLQYSPLVFDASVWEVFSALAFGATLFVIPAAARKDASLTGDYLENNEINLATLPPALVNVMPYRQMPALETLVVAGEACQADVMIKWYQGRRLVNAYGPTESTVCTTMHDYVPGDLNTNIGRPLPNEMVYVLDSDLMPVPVGVTGELFIGGASLARGYLNREQLTSERFIANPFVTAAGNAKGFTRLYKTGDLVRWLPNGDLDYIGRNDDQVKVRGHRIELGEIEKVISQLEGIQQCCVLAKERTIAGVKTKHLVAYYVVDRNYGEADVNIHERLSHLLPEYMMPSACVKLEALPLTINGKVDKRALPDAQIVASTAYVAPATDIEMAACAIWQELLGVPRVGVEDNFFRMGGNSILAIHVSHRMSKLQGCDVKVADVFRHKTISQLLAHRAGQSEMCIARLQERNARLSFAQERLWFIEQFEKGTNAYNVPMLYALDDETDKDGIKQALQQIVRRHEVLRSTIEQPADVDYSVQAVHHDPLVIEEVAFDDNEEYMTLIRAEFRRPFDLSREYPVRAKIYTIRPLGVAGNGAAEKRLLLINFHHIVQDGWSTQIFENEMRAFYRAYASKGANAGLPKLEIQYKDYAAWQRDYLSGEVLTNQLAYWKNKLSGYQPLALPADYERPGRIDYRGATHSFTLGEDISKRLRALAQNQGVSLHTVLLSGVNILFSKYTGQNDIVIGSLMANRHYMQTQALIGFFVNAQANRTILDPSQSFISLVNQVHQDQVEAQAHQDLPFEKLINELGVERDPSRHPVFQVIFTVRQGDEQSKDPGAQPSYFHPYVKEGEVYEVARFDLTISIDDSGDALSGQVNYATGLFSPRTIGKLTGHYSHLLDLLSANPESSYEKFGLLDAETHQQLVCEWNNTDKVYPRDLSVIDFFNEQVRKDPDNTAISFGDRELSYAQLDRQSDRLAQYLTSNYGVQPNDRVGIVLDRSDNMIVAILGILKAGAAYVCIDPDYPVARKEFIIQDTSLKVLITQTEYLFELGFYSGNLFAIDLQLDAVGDTAKFEGASPRADNLAYVIYTSGTTGNPKGVMISHGAVVSLVCNDYIDVSSCDVFAFLSSPSFDASTFEIFTPLLNGSKLVIPVDVKQLVSDTRQLKGFLEHHCVSVLWLTKTLFETIYYFDNNIFESLSCLIVGGEALNKNTINKLVNSASRPKKLLNGYGPTESTTFTCTYDMTETIARNNVPIGKPINNRRVYILDPHQNPVPVGVPGELYIGGAGLSAGYLNRTDLTDQRFVNNPFATEADVEKGYTRLYKTGDIVLWLPDGNIEYIGRNDHQVKIRGHRIELAEIEHTLSRIKGVKQACVLARVRKTEGADTKFLVGYCVLDDGAEILSQADILQQLAGRLPEYMMPATLMPMTSFPVTINGKLDRDNLPDPDLAAAADEYFAPTTETEKMVCKIWQDVLGLEKVGITDNFFRIGGDSILSIRLVSKMKLLGFNVSEKDIFDHKTIRDLLLNIGNPQQAREIAYKPFSLVSSELLDVILEENGLQVEDLDDIYPASYLQSGMLIESFQQDRNDTYHDVLSYGIAAAFEQEKFERIWQQLLDKHEQLRAAFILTGNGYQNVIFKSVDLASKIIPVYQYDHVEEYVNAEKNSDFDLTNPGIFRLGVLPNIVDGNFVLVFSIHHAITDGWSVASLISEFADAYVHGKPGVAEVMPPYGKVVGNELAALQNASVRQFWLDQLADYDLVSYNTLYNASGGVRSTRKDLAPALNTAILNAAKEMNITPDIIFQGVYSLALSVFCKTDDVVIGTVVNNRLKEEGGDRVFGLHLNTIPVRFKLDKRKSLREYLSDIFDRKLKINDNKAYPYARIKADLNFQEDIYQCSFNYMNFHVVAENIENRSISAAYSVARTSIPLTLHTHRFHDAFSLILSSGTGFIDPGTGERFLNTIVLLLETLTNDSDTPINDCVLLPESEYNQVVYDWNSADHSFALNKTVAGLFEEQAAKTPDHIALVYEGRQLTYRELDEKTNQLAYHIRARYRQRTNHELQPDTLIALCLDRSLEMVIGMLAVLKAGGAYVPIDPAYPQERIDFIIDDTQAQLALSQKHLAGRIQLPHDKVLYIDLHEALYQQYPVTGLQLRLEPASLAYVIYTSGTTGKPKGVMIQHESAVFYLLTFRKLIQRDHLNVYSVLNYCFDASLPTLLSGAVGDATTHIGGADVFSDNRVESYIQHNKIDTIRLTPSLLESLDLSNVRHALSIVMGGEKVSYRCVNQVIENKNIRLYNQYGPTESTVGTTVYRLAAAINQQLIGKAYAGKRVFVLDPLTHKPAPIGVIGELYIGGAGLARGYFNRADLTAERFIENPFATGDDRQKGYTRLYKTGDMVRWLPDGNLEYIGRNDDQVKIRGYRIELSEVEHALSSIQGVRQCCVLSKEREAGNGRTNYLAAYFVPDGKYELSSILIREKLSAMLPVYMVPAAFLSIDALPVTANGKLDKRALPEPDFAGSAEDYVAPANEMEIALCEVWTDILGLKQVGVTDDFFRIGGNSILAIQVSHRMSKVMECDVKVADIFRFKCIRGLRENVMAIKAEAEENVRLVF